MNRIIRNLSVMQKPLLAAMFCFLLGNVGEAQKPRFILDTGAPTNLVRSLQFSPDSTRLFAGGHDKAVHGWALRDDGPQPAAIPIQTLRWEIARGFRGVIYTTAASPTDSSLAVGGFSARDKTGDIFVFDTQRGLATRILRGHSAPVFDSDYSTDGQRLATISLDGELRVWSAPQWSSSRYFANFSRPQKRMAKFASVEFVSAGRYDLAVSYPLDAEYGAWRILLYNTTQGLQPIYAGPDQQGAIMAIADDPHSPLWATADQSGQVLVWKGEQVVRTINAGGVVEDLAFAPGGLLFVTTQFESLQQPATIKMFAAEAGQLIDQTETSLRDTNFACAVSPDGKWLACGGDSEVPVNVFPLVNKGQPIARPLSAGARFPIQGVAHRADMVAFAARNSYELGFGAPPTAQEEIGLNAITQVFDFGNPQLRGRGGDDQFISVEQQSRGWSVQPDPTRYSLSLALRNQPQCQITLDALTQGRMRSFCWLADQGRVYGIAVGTDHQNGIFIYQLVGGGQEAPMIRYFRDHTGAVNSLSVSYDGRYLASGSRDQTVKVWSLAGIQDYQTLRGGWQGGAPIGASWGANFAITNQGVTVTNVVPGGISFGRGLRQGDVIRAVSVLRNGKATRYENPRDVLTAIEQQPLVHQILVEPTRGGAAIPFILLVPAWEPLATLFTDLRGEWALSTPEGFYDASIDGDDLIGWQLNPREIGATPEAFDAEQFRAELERPDVMKSLLRIGNLTDTLRELQIPIPASFNRVVLDLAEQTPKITILSPLEGQHYKQEELITVQARVEYQDPRAASPLEAYCNGTPVGLPSIDRTDPQRPVFTWQYKPTEFYNGLTIVARQSGTNETYGETAVSFRTDIVQKTKPRLHILAIAGSEYQEQLKLGFPVVDAKSVVEHLQKFSQPWYDPGVVQTFYEGDVNSQNIQQAIAAYRGQIQEFSSDLLVVFVAGHGLAIDKEYYFVPPVKQITSLQQEAVIKQQGISWRAIEQLGDVKCRKLVMLDTCHSGNVVLQQRSASHMKAAMRTLQQKQMLVFAASDADSPALEDPELGHGVFTHFLLEGFNGKADSPKGTKDGRIDLPEIVDYVSVQVPRLTRFTQKQIPRVTPLQVKRLFVPLVSYGAVQPPQPRPAP